MPKKIHTHHKCNLHGHSWTYVCDIITGIRKQQEVIELPSQPNVKIIWSHLLQCKYCKLLITAPKEDLPNGEESKLALSE
ncbi:MAG: hypothetical protein ACUVUQ_07520 [Thermodesulfovibrionales bacterium]